MGRAYDPDQEALLKNIDAESDFSDDASTVAYLKRVSTPSPPLFFSIVINIVSLLFIIFLFYRIPQISEEISPFPQLVYSPAQDILAYKVVTFSNAMQDDRSKYQGLPTDEVDEAWEGLYSKEIITKIEEEQAKKLPDTTLGLHDEPGQYVVGLEVFHQLQCLDRIRKAFYPGRYSAHSNTTNEERAFEEEDLSQCFESIRQTLMCNADVSTMHWEWDEEQQRAKPKPTNVHTCRDFEAIQQWALNHQISGEFDMHIKPTWPGSNA
ncbi:MAG: hypothetical protein Q9157_005471 [Trypethelium eluteriae]